MKSLLLAGASFIALTAVAQASTMNFSYTGSMVAFTVTDTATYDVTLYGAQGGQGDSSAGGLGGLFEGQISLTAGQVIDIYVGGVGVYFTGEGSGGGGATIFSDFSTLMMVAGGGGGGYRAVNGGAGGSYLSGNAGGSAGVDYAGAGGAGVGGAGANGGFRGGSGGQSAAGGFIGGFGYINRGNGGFGGGGGAGIDGSGGGGGYAGGSANGYEQNGGGGSSGFSGAVSVLATTQGVQTGNGYASISWGSSTPVPEPASFDVLGAGVVGLGLARRRKLRA